MKTKAYKVRERIARYIYNRLQSFYYIEELKIIFWDNSWFVDTGESKSPRDYLYEWGEIEQSLGIIICIPLGKLNGTVMWDEEKEMRRRGCIPEYTVVGHDYKGDRRELLETRNYKEAKEFVSKLRERGDFDVTLEREYTLPF